MEPIEAFDALPKALESEDNYPRELYNELKDPRALLGLDALPKALEREDSDPS
jgi:hypothetical protein